MATLKLYGVGIFVEGKVVSFFDGRGYTENLENVRIFSEQEKNLARYEQGSHQRLNNQDDVRVIEFDLRPCFEIATSPIPTAVTATTLPPVPTNAVVT